MLVEHKIEQAFSGIRLEPELKQVYRGGILASRHDWFPGIIVSTVWCRETRYGGRFEGSRPPMGIVIAVAARSDDEFEDLRVLVLWDSDPTLSPKFAQSPAV